MFEEYRWGNRGIYIIGSPGFYIVRSCGNNRNLSEKFNTIDEARFWLTTFYPGAILHAH